MTKADSMVLVVGLGKMGSTVLSILKNKGYDAIGVDTLELAKILPWKPNMVFACVPYHAVLAVATWAAEINADYTDLTEDVQVRDAIGALGSKNLMISGSGLAPGYINMIAGRLSAQVKNPVLVEMFCGALPTHQFCNELGYEVSWSTSGLVRECTAPCEVKLDGEVIMQPALDGLRGTNFHGWPEMEAFYTSGGAGTTPHTLGAHTVYYKTMRYPGHRNKFLPLLNTSDPEKEILNACGLLSGMDVVFLAVHVYGTSGEIRYQEKILPQDGFTAIQYATASGAIKVWEAAKGRTGFVRPEHL